MADPRLSEVELRAWQALLHAHHHLVGLLDGELRAEHEITFSEYDVLLRLARAPERELRMSELAQRVLMSPSGLTRMVERLEAKRLVARVQDSNDGRVTLARLSERGHGLLRDAARTHLRGIRAHFTSRLSDSRLREVADALEAVVGPHVPH